MFMGDVAAHQQDLDQGPGAVPPAVGSLRLLPPGVVHRHELPCGTGLLGSGGPGKRSRLADQGFQVVVQIKPGLALGDQPFVAGDLQLAVVNHQLQRVHHGRSSGNGCSSGRFDSAVLAHRPWPGTDPAPLVLCVPALDHRVQLGKGDDFADGDHVIAAERADLPLDPALLVGALDPAVGAVGVEGWAELHPDTGHQRAVPVQQEFAAAAGARPG